MRTTINLDDDLLREAKLVARKTGKTLTALIEDALRERLARRQARQPYAPSELPVVHGRGLQAGVDLDDSAGLRELLRQQLVHRQQQLR